MRNRNTEQPLSDQGAVKDGMEEETMFVTKDQPVKVTPCEPGVTRHVMAYDKNVMMCEITFETGAKGNFHSHPHTQCTYILEGKFQFTVGDETRVVEKGDTILMPSGVRHGCECLEAGKLCDVFTPMREDFI